MRWFLVQFTQSNATSCEPRAIFVSRSLRNFALCTVIELNVVCRWVAFVRSLCESGQFDWPTLVFVFASSNSDTEFCGSGARVAVTQCFESLLDSQRENLLSLWFQEESWFALTFWAVARNFSDTWNFWGKRFHNGSRHPIMTDGRRQTGRQNLRLRLASSSRSRVNSGEESALPTVASSCSKSFGDPFSTEDYWM